MPKDIFHAIYHYFDKLEDRVRGRLSRYPIIYTLIAGTAIVLFWRGVWSVADQLSSFLPAQWAWIDGLLSLVVSVFVLLITGLFVSFFVSDQIILSGVRQEKKMIEKTETEVREETAQIEHMHHAIDHMHKDIERIEDKLA